MVHARSEADRSSGFLVWHLQPPTPFADFTRRAAFGLPATTLVPIGASAAPARAEPPAPPSTATARQELAALTVAAPHSMDGYARDKFDIWSSQPGGCTTRQTVLARDGKDVQDKPGSCQPASGSWYSIYDDTVVTDVTKATRG
ncbi:hypothetical protein ABZ079_28260 [Streptomyces sp. NPDC006314]|uniref:hypothetical protein n=1 Tax=Streptomyces sp. NPDC006314 TaxID=3154475 RepID=UPI0033A056C7